MKNKEYIENNFSLYKNSKHGNLFIEDRVLYSYGYHYPLKFFIGDKSFKNIEGYSPTTTKHIGYTQADFDIKLENHTIHGKPTLSDVKTALNQEYQELTSLIATKKRKDTNTYRSLTERLEEVKDALNYVNTLPVEGETKPIDTMDMAINIAKLGNIFCDTQKDKNAWKLKMLKAGIGEGLDIPDNWEELSEEEKETRLNGAIEQF